MSYTKTDVLQLRDFLLPDRLDAIMVRLEREVYVYEGEDAEAPVPEITHSVGIHLEEMGQGHFCYVTDDLDEAIKVANRIADFAGRLRDACVMAKAEKCLS